MALRTVNISGGGGRRIRAELASRDDAVDHGVVMLPGLGYTCAMPAFYYLDELAIGLGAAVLSLAPDYRQDERFGAFPLGDEQRDWLRDDVESGIAALVAMHDVSRLTVISKSLTTIGMAGVDWTNHVRSDRTVRLVWLTPLLRDPAVVDRLTTSPVSSLIVIGTADHHYDQPTVDRLSEQTAVSAELIEGAGHSFGQRGDIDRSLANIGQVVEAVRWFAFRTM